MRRIDFDIIVVGGGVIALAAAFRLAQTGARIAVASYGREGASVAAAGMLAPSFESDHPRAAPGLAPILRQALAMWPSFAHDLRQHTRLDFDFSLQGIVGIDLDIDGGEPVAIPDGYVGTAAKRVQGEGQVDPRKLMQALSAAGEALGAVFIPSDVMAIKTGAVVECKLGDGRTVTADQVVVASGADAHRLVSLPAPLTPVRGRAFLIPQPALLPDFVVRTPMAYFCPKSDGTMYVGATDESGATDRDTAEALWSRAVSVCPAIEGSEVLATFDGLRPASAAGVPIVSYVGKDERVIVATGTDRNGILCVPWCVDQLVSLTASDKVRSFS